jgi:hypothetical protein
VPLSGLRALPAIRLKRPVDTMGRAVRLSSDFT